MRNRLIVVDTMTHQEVGKPMPITMDSRFARELDTDEESYQRSVAVGPDPIVLDLGWVAGKCSMLMLTNTLPTVERKLSRASEKAQQDGAEVTVYFDGKPGVLVALGESARFRPISGVKMSMRCPVKARVRILAVPE